MGQQGTCRKGPASIAQHKLLISCACQVFLAAAHKSELPSGTGRKGSWHCQHRGRGRHHFCVTPSKDLPSSSDSWATLLHIQLSAHPVPVHVPPQNRGRRSGYRNVFTLDIEQNKGREAQGNHIPFISPFLHGNYMFSSPASTFSLFFFILCDKILFCHHCCTGLYLARSLRSVSRELALYGMIWA